MQEEERRALKESEDLAQALPGEESPLSLGRAVTEVLGAINRGQLEYRVEIASVMPQVAGGGGTLQSLDTLSTPVGNTALRTLTIQVKGSYREYVGLRNYLEYLKRQPAALTRLVIAGNTFELDLKVYGTL